MRLGGPVPSEPTSLSTETSRLTARPVSASEVDLGPLTDDDLPDIVTLERECFSAPWPARSFYYALRDSLVEALGARLGPDLVGYVICRRTGGEFLIANLAVSPSRRRRGIGRRLLEQAIRLAEKHGSGWVVLDVRESNAAAIELYRSFGFRVQGRRINYYSSPVEDSLIMRKDLL